MVVSCIKTSCWSTKKYKMKMPRISPKLQQYNSSGIGSSDATRQQHQQVQNGGQVVAMRNVGGSESSGGGRNHSGHSTLPSSPNNSG